MALRIAIIAETCICLVLAAAFATAKVRLSSVSDSVTRLTAELELVQRARADAVAEIEFLRGAMRRLDATIKTANAAIDKAENAHHERIKAIADAPEDWLSCPLPAGVCDAFDGYTMPATAADTGGTDAAMRAAKN